MTREAVNTAFSDNPAAGCAVGVDGSVPSVVVRQQDLDSMPGPTPGLTLSGRPTLKNLAKRDRVLWWRTSMGSNIVAALKEGFATAPGITAIDLAVLTRLPGTRRLGFVAYGRWTRQAIESTPWREPEDALRFQDIRQDVACSVTTTASDNLPSAIKLLETSRVPGLQDLPTMLRTNPAPANRHSPASTSPSAPAPHPTTGPHSQIPTGSSRSPIGSMSRRQDRLLYPPHRPHCLPRSSPARPSSCPRTAGRGCASPSASPARTRTSPSS